MKHNLPYLRRSSHHDSRNSSPKGIKSPRYGTSEFFASLENQVKRLDPEFFFVWGEESPLTQALSCVKQAIDTILNKSNTAETSFSMKKDNILPLNEQSSVGKIKDKDKEKEWMKKMEECEAKAEKVQKEKEKLRKMKKTLFELEDELRGVKEELNNEYLLLNQNKNKFRCEKEVLDKEKLEISIQKKMILEQKLGIDQQELEIKAVYDDLEIKQEILTQERAEMERERWMMDQERAQINEKIQNINLSSELLALEFARLDQERLFLTPHNLSMNKPSDSKPIDFYDESKSPSFAVPELISKPELDSLISRFQEDLSKAENDLIAKAQELDDREEQIIAGEKIIEDKLAELQMIKESLAKSSNDLNDLIQSSFPKVNSESKHIEKLLQQLSDTQKQLLNQSEAAKDEQALIESIKTLSSEEQVTGLLKILRSRLEKLLEREKNVQEKDLDLEEKQKNLEILEQNLKSEQLQLRFEHETRLIEIEEAKNEMLILQTNLETHLMKIDQKEKQLFGVIQGSKGLSAPSAKN